ncbi:MAG: iron ABC transporter permease [Phycisphaeraceae bacterium]|nr:iron ABC transporter permease [Phycisphaeraceae bacterium]
MLVFLIWPILLTVGKGFIRADGASRGAAYILFNHDPDQPGVFNYAGLDARSGQWVIGRRDAEGWHDLAVAPGARANQNYELRLVFEETGVTLASTRPLVRHQFELPAGGRIGLSAVDAPATFSRLDIRYARQTPGRVGNEVIRFTASEHLPRDPSPEARWSTDRNQLVTPVSTGQTAIGFFADPEESRRILGVEVVLRSTAVGWFTLDYFLGIFRDPVLVNGLLNSLWIAIGTTLLCLIIALPLAMVSARCEFPGKAIFSALVLVPLILPPFVGAIGLRAIMGRAGSLNALLGDIGVIDADAPGLDFLGAYRFTAVIVLQALHLYPILYLNLVAALANLDPSLDEAAKNMGAGSFRRFWRITVPLIMPGVFAGGTIVFIWAFTELGTPLMLNVRDVMPVQVFEGLRQIETNPRPFALVVVMLLASVILYGLGRLALGRQAYAMQSKASVGSSTLKLGWVGSLMAMSFFGLVTFIAVLPHIGVIFTSLTMDGQWYRSVFPQEWTLTHYENALSHPLAVGSIQNSLLLASAAMVLCIIVGLAISYLNVRCRMKLGVILDGLAMLPLAVPGIVLAFGYIAMSLVWPLGPGTVSEGGFLQVVGTDPNPFPLLIIAYAVRRLPYVVRSASAGLQQTSGMLEEAALNLGASTMTAIRRIVLPLIMANLIAGGILAFSFAMLEVSDSLILAQQERHFPITKAIFSLFNRLGDGPYIASAMGVWAMMLLALTLVAASMLMGKRMGAIFRI